MDGTELRSGQTNSTSSNRILNTALLNDVEEVGQKEKKRIKKNPTS